MSAGPRLVLLHGDEQYLIGQEARRVLDEWRRHLVSDFGFEAVDAGRVTAAQLRDAILQAPFLDPYRVVAVKALQPARAESLAPAIAELPDTTRLLLTVNGRLSPGNRLLKAAGAADALVKEFQQLKGRKLNDWANERARQLKLPANLAALTVRLSPPDLGILDSELKKLAAYRESGHPLDMSVGRELLAGGREEEFFQLTDRIVPRVTADAWRVARNLVENGANATTIGYRIARQVSLVLDVRSRQERGQSLADMQAELREHPFVVQKAYEMARATTTTRLQAALGRLLDYEWEVKSGQIDAELGLDVVLAAL